MQKNVKFSFTVKAKDFPLRIANLLEEQADTSSIYDVLTKATQSLRQEKYQVFLSMLGEVKEDLEILLMAVNDAEDNVRGFVEASQEKAEEAPQVSQAPQQKFEEPKVEVVQNTQPSVDAFSQLQQLQSLVNTIKDLKPKE
jgi:leucyl aminopeptidase